MWVKIHLICAEGSNELNADLEIKVDKTYCLLDFELLLYKLALDIWN